ncbi:hypothetical protein F4824DRAFT_493510 [Ustulina deusta]|nr:hypothetical protein F4824DRAFT_493510 [Ustulina deusta]
MSHGGSIIITGGTAGLGYLVLGSRTDGDGAADRINAELGQSNTICTPLDLSDIGSVRKYAENWASKGYPSIRALLLNAALLIPGAMQKRSDGLEKTFSITHVGNAALFHLMFPHLASNARVVVVSSGTHDPAQVADMPDPSYSSAEGLARPSGTDINMSGWQRYPTAKLCNVLWGWTVAYLSNATDSEKSRLGVFT